MSGTQIGGREEEERGIPGGEGVHWADRNPESHQPHSYCLLQVTPSLRGQARILFSSAQDLGTLGAWHIILSGMTD